MEKENNDSFKDYQALMSSFEALKKSEANPFFKSKYVPLKAILPTVKEKCAEHNFVVAQIPRIENGESVLVTEIQHKDGKTLTGEMKIISKDPTDPQKVGAGLTYARRYMLTCMFGLEEEDDDGNTAAGQQPPRVNKTTYAPRKSY